VRGSRFPKRKRKKQWVNLPLLPTHSSLRGGKVALEQLDPLSFSMVRRPCCRPWVLVNLFNCKICAASFLHANQANFLFGPLD